jgi:hypothetical protein
MRYVGVGNVTTAGLALALPERWELWRAFARARIVSLCRTADRWDVGRRVWRQPSNASKVSSGSRLCENALRVECDVNVEPPDRARSDFFDLAKGQATPNIPQWRSFHTKLGRLPALPLCG